MLSATIRATRPQIGAFGVLEAALVANHLHTLIFAEGEAGAGGSARSLGKGPGVGQGPAWTATHELPPAREMEVASYLFRPEDMGVFVGLDGQTLLDVSPATVPSASASASATATSAISRGSGPALISPRERLVEVLAHVGHARTAAPMWATRDVSGVVVEPWMVEEEEEKETSTRASDGGAVVVAAGAGGHPGAGGTPKRDLWCVTVSWSWVLKPKAGTYGGGYHRSMVAHRFVDHIVLDATNVTGEDPTQGVVLLRYESQKLVRV